MNHRTKDNSIVKLQGVLQNDFSFSHEVFGEKFYNAVVTVKRLSNAEDNIPIMVSDRLFDTNVCYEGMGISIVGEYRSYNKHMENGRRLKLYVFAKEVYFFEKIDALNEITIEGYICKPPMYRKTPLDREIADVLLAANRQYGRSSYIPCICWGRNAGFVSQLEVGTYIKVQGRIQSREYTKRITDDMAEVRTAYEVSISKILRCLVKEYETGDMDICEQYAICEECPCYVMEIGECVHPYVDKGK